MRESFQYNKMGKIIHHTYRSGKQVSYRYDNFGNIIEKQGISEDAGESEDTGISEDADKSGNYYRYEYNKDGLLTKVVGGGITYHYTYDSSKRMIEKSACGRSLIRYTYDLNGNSYHGDGLNLYAYVGNNPVRYVDPSGHCRCGKNNGVESGDEGFNNSNVQGGNQSGRRLVNINNYNGDINDPSVRLYGTYGELSDAGVIEQDVVIPPKLIVKMGVDNNDSVDYYMGILDDNSCSIHLLEKE